MTDTVSCRNARAGSEGLYDLYKTGWREAESVCRKVVVIGSKHIRVNSVCLAGSDVARLSEWQVCST